MPSRRSGHQFGEATPRRRSQTVRYYGVYSNKSRGQSSPIPDRIIRPPKPQPPPEDPPPAQILLIPAPPKRRACDMRPLWRDLILKVWGGDPLQKISLSPIPIRKLSFIPIFYLSLFLTPHRLVVYCEIEKYNWEPPGLRQTFQQTPTRGKIQPCHSNIISGACARFSPTPISPPSGPAQRLFRRLPAKSKFLAAPLPGAPGERHR
jgi:hypothetical protein